MEEEERINPRNLAIFKKGEEILQVVRQIGEIIPEDNEILQSIREQMFLDAAFLSVKVGGVTNVNLYDLKMEAAAIIRKAARDLMVSNHSLKAFGFKEVEYFKIVRDLLEEYRLLFIQWVQTFDPWCYQIDRWGLFNPPGVGPFDKDPDRDVPWNLDEEEW
jgi:hypothetical protein